MFSCAHLSCICLQLSHSQDTIPQKDTGGSLKTKRKKVSHFTGQLRLDLFDFRSTYQCAHWLEPGNVMVFIS